MNNSNIKKIGNIVGIVSLLFFFVCIAWGILLTSPELKSLHYNLILLTYPGFSFSIIGILIGMVEAYIYGFVLGSFFDFLCKKLCLKK